MFSGEGVDSLDIECDRDQRGSIEQLLIAHPDVNCESEVLFKIDFAPTWREVEGGGLSDSGNQE